MSGRPSEDSALHGRFGAFIAERFPFALGSALDAFVAAGGKAALDSAAIDAVRVSFPAALARVHQPPVTDFGEVTPGVATSARLRQAVEDLAAACDGFLRRASIRASLTGSERREILQGMILTRAIDNRLKTFFTGGEVLYRGAPFQGKGFRSLGQEAIYAAGIRLRRGETYREDGSWRGDIVAPLIRDLGVALAMRPGAETVRMVLSAQMAKAGPPMNGKDLHIGDFDFGILPPAAPLGISSLTIAGIAMAFAREASGRVALSFIGEGGTSLGEWHEAINLSAAHKLPAVFCVENNQTALSTPVHTQSAARVFADKAVGYGIPGITIDGTDPDEIAAAFGWSVERAREGRGPSLIELVCMRMCGHAHHDDMLYVGRETQPSWGYPSRGGTGYADPEQYAFWAARDPIATYAARLEREQLIDAGEIDRMKKEAQAIVESEAKRVIEAAWPDPAEAASGVFADAIARPRIEVLDEKERREIDFRPQLPPVEAGPPFDTAGRTFLEGVVLGLRDALDADPRVFIYGQDVGGTYGNAFLMLRPLLPEYGNRILNSPLAEGGVLGVCIGAALAGQRPIGEMQFNDFVATGFNQLVNSAAKIRYRWGGSVPMVLRMPWGGLRHAGPYHSQNTEAWFYRTPGLKIVAPSTPADARALLLSALKDPDPVLYYEHIALYRDPRVRQALGERSEETPIGKAALRRAGKDLVIISYGAFVHTAMRVAQRLADDGVEASVLDLRTLVPLDRATVLAAARHCGRVMIVHEDTRTGGIGESVAAIIQEEAFESLDAPVRIIGALDTPVPYSPPLEEQFLPAESEIERAARLLVRY